jgi:hypothetical protein
MKRSASNTTFGVTCVVERSVATHFLKLIFGVESGPSTGYDVAFGGKFSIRFRVAPFSNQKRQVTYE